MEKRKIILVPLYGRIVTALECQTTARLIESYIRNDGNCMVLDFSRVEDLSGSFMNFLAGIVNLVKALQKQIAIVAPPQNLRDLLEYSGLLPHITLHENFEDLEAQSTRCKAILVIDDDPMMRDITSEFVLQMGFKVLTAAHGEAGVDLYRRHWASILLVILDLQMPGLNGEETLARIKLMNPRVKVIMVTGSMDVERLECIRNVLGVPVLSKPFMMEDLEEALNQRLMLA
jgi:CheY-like chemotaxis protein/anti-anti-sigma regulatory factor